jgi:hypothetical protein
MEDEDQNIHFKNLSVHRAASEEETLNLVGECPPAVSPRLSIHVALYAPWTATTKDAALACAGNCQRRLADVAVLTAPKMQQQQYGRHSHSNWPAT